MIGQLQQIASSALILLVGVLALGVWRRLGPVRRDRAALAWGVTAANFLVVGVYATAHSLIAATSFAAGKESGLYAFVSDWSLAANVARCVASVVFGVLLTTLMVVSRRTAPRVAQAAPIVLVVTSVAATAGAGLLPSTNAYAFATIIAVLNAATAVVLMIALLAGVQNDGIDQLLWLALAVYVLKETVSVSLLAVMAWWSLAYVATYYTIFYLLQVGLMAAVAGLAARRLYLASGGRRVPALFERLHALRRPTHG